MWDTVQRENVAFSLAITIFSFLYAEIVIIDESILEISYHIIFISVESKKSYGRSNISAHFDFSIKTWIFSKIINFP